jgi:AcrR family transcriptional regulator
VARPSRNIDQRLLAAGRELFADAGCAGLAVRAVAERAGVNPGMLHYHFASKDHFLRALLQQMYEEMFATLSVEIAQDAAAIERLRAAVLALARFLRANRRTVARVWIDALGGSAVAREFMQANAPRHVGLLVGLLEQAQREGALRELPPVQRLMLLLGGVALPLVFVAGLVDVAVLPAAARRAFEAQVMGDAAIAQRVDIVIEALRAPRAARQRGKEARA